MHFNLKHHTLCLYTFNLKKIYRFSVKIIKDKVFEAKTKNGNKFYDTKKQ